MRNLIGLFLLLSACGTNELPQYEETTEFNEQTFIESNLKTFADLIEECDTCKENFNNRQSSFEFKDLPNNTLGTCKKFYINGEIATYTITFSNSLKQYHKSIQDYVFLHEMGHCILDQDHQAGEMLMQEFAPSIEQIEKRGGPFEIASKFISKVFSNSVDK